VLWYLQGVWRTACRDSNNYVAWLEASFFNVSPCSAIVLIVITSCARLKLQLLLAALDADSMAVVMDPFSGSTIPDCRLSQRLLVGKTLQPGSTMATWHSTAQIT
jgi:hypothetical protein